MASKLLTLAFLTTLTYAQAGSSLSSSTLSASGPSTTVSLYFPGGLASDAGGMIASVISAGPAATAYYITCAPSTASADYTDCGFGPGVNLTVSDKSIYTMSLVEPDEFTASVVCTVQGTAVCVESYGGPQANDPGTTSEKFPAESATLNAVTVTAGLDKLASASASSTASAGSKTTSSSGAKQTGAAGNSTSAPSLAAPGASVWTAMGLVSVAAMMSML